MTPPSNRSSQLAAAFLSVYCGGAARAVKVTAAGSVAVAGLLCADSFAAAAAGAAGAVGAAAADAVSLMM
jgi:hypothetical protein